MADNRLQRAVALVKSEMAYGDWVKACQAQGIDPNAVYPKMLNNRLVAIVWKGNPGEKPELFLAPKGGGS